LARPEGALDVLGEDVHLQIDLVERGERPQRRHAERVRDERDGEACLVQRGDRERDSVDGDRPLLDAVV
jgi:hypothetical protein